MKELIHAKEFALCFVDWKREAIGNSPDLKFSLLLSGDYNNP